jgi:hypothetical protein
MVKIELDAFIVGFQLPRRVNLGEVTAHFYHALAEGGAEIDPWPHQCVVNNSGSCPRCVPMSVTTALAAGERRLRQRGFLDILFPSRVWQEWQPVASWLCDVGRILENAVGQWRELCAFVPGGVVARSRQGVCFIFGLVTESDSNPAIVLLFDWRSFNRCENGPDEVSTLVGLISSTTGTEAAAGGPSDMWQRGLSRGVSEPGKSGAYFVCSERAITGFDNRRMKNARTISGWRGHSTGTSSGGATEESTVLDGSNLFSARWTGCSGKFVTGAMGDNEADIHFEKHVRRQREWSDIEMPDAGAYVKTAARTLDAVDDVFEFWQSANHAVIKYDLCRDIVSIGNLHDGNIRTCFRPGGADYVLRKLRTRRWTPPLILGLVEPDMVQDDSELAALFAELERTVAESSAEALAVVSAEESVNIVSTIASLERSEFLAWCVRSRYLMAQDEARLDSIDIALADARAALDVALENGAAASLVEAVSSIVKRYLDCAPAALIYGDPEELANLLLLRDRVEFVRMATRASGPHPNIVPAETFRPAELGATDAMVFLHSGPVIDTASFDWWPETFVWRKRLC